MTGPYYGKYRGVVVSNFDPTQTGRLQIMCAPVLGLNALAWALPCVPFAGASTPDRMPEGFFMQPSVGSNVWIEFEQGDPNRPIWTGCFWDQGGAPATLPTIRTIVSGGAKVTLDALPAAGGITISVGPPTVPVACELTCSAAGIEIKIGPNSIKLDPVRGVVVNDGALEVM